MSIKGAVGLQGHGKTYETVKFAIVPAVAKKRRVVTNIRGLDHEKICEYLIAKSQNGGGPAQAGGSCSDFGQIVTFISDDIQKPGFFPVLNSSGYVDETKESFVKPGDLVIVDEAWRFWATDSKISAEHMSFFREHRQFVGESGDTCDLIWISQSVTDIHRKLRTVTEMTTVCAKTKELGVDSAYVTEIFARAALRKADRITLKIQKYDPEVFPLYKSYSSGVGTENAIDERQNKLKDKWFIGRFVFSIVVLVVIVIYVVNWYKSKVPEKSKEPEKVNSISPVPGAAVVMDGQPVTVLPTSESSKKDYGKVRLVGYMKTENGLMFILETPEGKTRILDADADYKIGLHSMAVKVDGEMAVPWSGGRSGGGMVGGLVK